MILWIHTCQTLVLSTRRTLMCVLCNKASSSLRSDTCHFLLVVGFDIHFLLVVGFDIKHTNTHTHTAHSGASRLTHLYEYIFRPHVICSQQLSLLNLMINSLISKIYFSQCLLFTCKSHVSVD